MVNGSADINRETNIIVKKIKEWIRYYVRATAVLILPVFYFVILYFLAARAWQSATVQINMLFAQRLLMKVLIIFSIYPLLWLCASAKRFFEFAKLPPFIRTIYIFLLGGIVSAHIVTWLAVHAGQYDFYTFECLIRYDLILLDSYVYWKTDRKGLEIGLKCLSVIIWLSAIYGIAEFFLPDKFLLYKNLEGRARSVYSNPIISGSAWLMGFWLPFPGKKAWVKGFVKSCYVAAIFFTVSKDAWIGLGVSIVLYLFWNRKKLVKKCDKQQLKYLLVFVGLLLILIGGVLFGNKDYKDLILLRWTNIQTDKSFVDRMYHVKDTLQYLFHEAPFVRVIFGFGNSLSREFIKSTPHFTGLTNLDNQYIISLYEFGLFGLFSLILWAVVCFRVAVNGNSWQKAAGMGIIAMLIPIGTYDPFQWDIITFLLLVLSVIALSEIKLKPNRGTVIKYLRMTICFLLIGVFVAWLSPYSISWCRTLFHSLQDLYVGKWGYLGILCLLTGIVSFGIVACVLAFCLFALRFPKKNGTIVTGILFIISVLWILWGNGIITAEERKLNSTIREESKILQMIMTNVNGHVYEDRYPWIYQKYEKNIKASVFSGESIIPEDSITLMTSGNDCLDGLLQKGFLFTYLSEDHALYTNDMRLIRALEDYGSHLTAYYHSFGSPEEYLDPGLVSGYDIHRFYDKVRRLVREEYYTIEGERTVNEKGYFAVEYSYDLWGRNISERYYGIDGQPSILPDGYSIFEKEYDNFDHLIWMRFYDGYHEPVLKGYGYAAVHNFYNEDGQIIREEYYGTDGELKELSSGYAATEREYDSEGNLTVQTFYNKENQPVQNSSGYWKIVKTFNEKNQAIREEYFNVDGSAAWLPGGYYMQEMEYDERGNISIIRYLDREGRPTTRAQGYTEIHRTYNSKNQIIQEECFGLEGKLVVNTGGYASTRFEYDSLGNLTAQSYYGIDGNPITLNAGYWKVEREYNFRKKVEKESYYDISGDPVMLSTGYASLTMEYDETGNASVIRYFDKDGKPVLRTDGFAELRRIYDKGRVSQETYFDINRNPTMHKDGYFSVGKEYDEFGNLTAQMFFDSNGEPALCQSGYWKKVQCFNSRNLAIWEEYYGLDNSPAENASGYAAVEFEYDEAGNRVLYNYYNAAGDKIIRTQGYASIRHIFSADRKLLREEYLDLEGELVCCPGGYAAFEREYDDAGNIMSECYYDQNYNPIVQQKGYWKVEWKYNKRRQIIQEKYLGIEGALIALQDGYAVVEINYDERGILQEKKYYDINGERIL